jgi:hypothetical protein
MIGSVGSKFVKIVQFTQGIPIVMLSNQNIIIKNKQIS